MKLLITGLLIFFVLHMVPWSTSLRGRLVSQLGDKGYKACFALIAFVGLGLIIYGKAEATFVPVFEPSANTIYITKFLVLLAFIFLPASNMPTNIKRFTAHPMLWGIVCWSIGHLVANGDMASILLFGGFAVYGLSAMISSTQRGAIKSSIVHPLAKDIAVIVVGVLIYGLITYFHGSLFGYPIL
jgi:uncharacterized membrane protein